eukprot:5316663-Pyramimonas_sp.AAC.2
MRIYNENTGKGTHVELAMAKDLEWGEWEGERIANRIVVWMWQGDDDGYVVDDYAADGDDDEEEDGDDDADSDDDDDDDGDGDGDGDEADDDDDGGGVPRY